MNQQNVYEGGRRCEACGIPSVSDVCARCALNGGAEPTAYEDVANDREPYDWELEPIEAFVPRNRFREQWMYPRDGGDDGA